MTGNSQRDELVGAALRALPIEDSRDSFWDDLEVDLRQADGLPANAADTAAPQVGRARRRWSSAAPQVLAVAAASLLVIAGVVWALRSPSNETTELQVATQEDTTPEVGGDPEVDDTSDPADTGDAASSIEPTDVAEAEAAADLASGGASQVDLTQVSSELTLPLAMQPVAGSDSGDVVLYAWPLPSAASFGCEGDGSRHAFIALDANGRQIAPVTASATWPSVVEGPDDQIAIAEWCFDQIQAVQVGSFLASGQITIDRWLIPPDGFSFSHFKPVWSLDGRQLLVHVVNSDGDLWLATFDVGSGSVEVEPAVNRVLAQLTQRAYLTANQRGVFLDELSLIDLDLDPDLLDRVFVAVSTDRRHVAVAYEDAIVITDLDGQSHRFDAGQTIITMDWSPTGQLIFSLSGDSGLMSYDIDRPGEFVEAFAPPGSWFDLEFAAGGETLAIFGLSEPDRSRTTRILRLGGNDADGTGSPVGTSPPFGTVEVTVGDQPLRLRGIGVIESGMTVAEAEAATGGKLVEFASLDGCAHAVLAGDPNSPSYMVTTYNEDGPDLEWSEGTIVRIELGRGATTISGIAIGSTKAEVLAAYGDRIEVTPHHYTFDEGGEYLTFVPVDEADSGFRLVMETFNDEVTAIRSGLTGPVQWVEGCA